MPMKPNSCCKHPRCSNRTSDTYCEEHRPKEEKPEYHRLYKTKRWDVESDSYLQEHPYCVKCKEEGKIRAAVVVDHIEPHRGDLELFWDHDNWQGLCLHHHNIKSGKEAHK